MADTVLLYTVEHMGHVIPMAELGKRFLAHGLSVTVVVAQLNLYKQDRVTSYITALSTAHPSLSFHLLPPVTLPSGSESDPTATTQFTVLNISTPLLLDYVCSTPSVRALVLDCFCAASLTVGAELNLPSYVFVPFNATTLSVFLYLPTLHRQSTARFKDMGDTPIAIPGLPGAVRASDLPSEVADRSAQVYKEMLFLAECVPNAKGILVNSIRSLEPNVLLSLAAGNCVPDRPMPPVYCIGPIIRGEEFSTTRQESLTWLDEQPRGSVVFLSFGSLGAFPEAQLREIATGLERSGTRFLWVVRGPPQTAETRNPFLWTDPDLEALLPEGFVDRTAGRGLVVKSWAPQVDVLEHEAVGGFVTHCGWNSVLESIVAGVAMIAWPLYAEQKMNMNLLCEALRVAVEMRCCGGDGMVVAEEVEERVRWLMDSEEGKELRARVEDVGKSARAALREHGASHADTAELVRSFTDG